MIKLNLKSVLDQKGLTITQLYRETGISRTTLTPLVNNPESVKAIRFSTLDSLCKVLNVQPSDFIEYIDSDLSFKIHETVSNGSIFSTRIQSFNGFESTNWYAKLTIVNLGIGYQSYIIIETLDDSRFAHWDLANKTEQDKKAYTNSISRTSQYITTFFSKSFLKELTKSLVDNLLNEFPDQNNNPTYFVVNWSNVFFNGVQPTFNYDIKTKNIN